MKDSFKSLFELIHYARGMQKKCEDPTGHKCVDKSLKVFGALAVMGEFLAGTVGDCSVGHQVAGAPCAGKVLGVIHELDRIAAAGFQMSHHCDFNASHAETQFFAQEDAPVAPAEAVSLIAWAVIAVLPISAALSFFAGVRSRKRNAAAVVRELESLVSVQNVQDAEKSDLEDVLDVEIQ
jgi:hypothetical protein